MPTRLLREGILDSRPVNALSEEAELFYRRLMSVVDDHGRIEADPEILRVRCFPRRLDSWPVARVSSALQETSECLRDDGLPLVTTYDCPNRKKYLQINNFNQRVRGANSKCPPPDGQMTVTRPADDRHPPASRARAEPETEAQSESETQADADAKAVPPPSASATSSSTTLSPEKSLARTEPGSTSRADAPGGLNGSCLAMRRPPEEINRSILAARLVDELLAVHPERGSRSLAIHQAEAEIANETDPASWCHFVRNSHAAHRPAWTAARKRNRNAFIPQLHIWFRDGDYRSPPSSEAMRTSSWMEEIMQEVH